MAEEKSREKGSHLQLEADAGCVGREGSRRFDFATSRYNGMSKWVQVLANIIRISPEESCERPDNGVAGPDMP
ncbi:hypothetical protein [Mesorhizobium sp. WSM4311]|uniref:hypothetical protein n=1 Tax=Mesorhizobium sp. WSM4311 TaxID=2029410 RepID=UPI0015CA7D3F|nr:hypothetical protein [Mesorhizobium sp. WSM4311]